MIVFWNIFFWRFGDFKKRIALSEKKPPLTLVVYIVTVGPLFAKIRIVRDHLLGLPCCDQQSVQSWQSIDHSKAKSVLLNLAKSLAVAEQCMEAAACAAWAASEAVARAAASKWLWWSGKYLLFSNKLSVFLKSKIFSQKSAYRSRTL